jgi:hypothetical protein
MEFQVECFDTTETYEYSTDNMLVGSLQALHDFSQEHDANFFGTTISHEEWVLDNHKTNPLFWEFVTESSEEEWKQFMDDHCIDELTELVSGDDYESVQSYIQEWRTQGQSNKGP